MVSRGFKIWLIIYATAQGIGAEASQFRRVYTTRYEQIIKTPGLPVCPTKEVPKMKILAVDDDPFIRELLPVVFREADYPYLTPVSYTHLTLPTKA